MAQNVSGEQGATGATSGGGRAAWRPDWKDIGLRLLGVAGVILAVWLVYLFLDAFLPRWWAQVIGNAVDGSFAAGAWWGLMVGAVFTLVPVLFLAQAVLTGRSWQVRSGYLAAAVVFAVPNLLTLGIVLGTSAAAHAGERILDVDGPAFRGGSAWGAGVGGVVALVIVTMGVLYRRRGARLKELRADRS
ncbi:hypothetical protein [Promicromonospora sp. NPDC057488]|uniref:hypothetical protein n=1 Tax=Promicromonospora sp. NPDC057488 TaxID=3346147 RepID=UPI00366DD73C